MYHLWKQGLDSSIINRVIAVWPSGGPSPGGHFGFDFGKNVHAYLFILLSTGTKTIFKTTGFKMADLLEVKVLEAPRLAAILDLISAKMYTLICSSYCHPAPKPFLRRLDSKWPTYRRSKFRKPLAWRPFWIWFRKKRTRSFVHLIVTRRQHHF